MVDDHEMEKRELRFKNLESWVEGIEGLLQDLVWVLAEKHKYEGDEIFSRTRVLRWIGKEPYIWDGTQTLQALEMDRERTLHLRWHSNSTSPFRVWANYLQAKFVFWSFWWQRLIQIQLLVLFIFESAKRP